MVYLVTSCLALAVGTALAVFLVGIAPVRSHRPARITFALAVGIAVALTAIGAFAGDALPLLGAALASVPIPILPDRAAKRLRFVARAFAEAARSAEGIALAYENIRDRVTPAREFSDPDHGERYRELAYEITDSAANDPFDLRGPLSEYARLAEQLRPVVAEDDSGGGSGDPSAEEAGGNTAPRVPLTVAEGDSGDPSVSAELTVLGRALVAKRRAAELVARAGGITVREVGEVPDGGAGSGAPGGPPPGTVRAPASAEVCDHRETHRDRYGAETCSHCYQVVESPIPPPVPRPPSPWAKQPAGAGGER